MKKTVEDFNFNNKTVIIRCDLNVPIKDGVIKDDKRIRESIKTINYILNNNAKVIVLSHLGRIKTEEDKSKYSLKPVAQRLGEILNKNVLFVPETRGKVLEKTVKNMKNKDIIMIENTRFEDVPGNKESGNDKELSKYWASLGDIFINDAFGTAHRAHASNVGIASILPSGMGFLMKKELDMLNGVLKNPMHPYVVIMGGAKISDKIGVIDTLIKKCDCMLLGGGIANTFLMAKGYDMGTSLVDKDFLDYCKKAMKDNQNKIILPVDAASSTNVDAKNKTLTNVDNIAKNEMMLDIGPKSIDLYKKYIKGSKTVFWNGPVGFSENDTFSFGTKELCKALYESGAKVIVGGGDSAAAAIKYGYENKFTHISTGGGASLELIERKTLPGVDAIQDR